RRAAEAFGVYPGQHGQVPAILPGAQAAARRSLRGARSGGRGRDDPHRHRAGTPDAAGPQGRNLRRARRRAVVGGLLPPGGHDLRFVLPVLCTHRLAGRGPGGDQGAAARGGAAQAVEGFSHQGDEEVKLAGARIVLECLKREGVDLIFGLPGGAVLPIYDALYDFEGLRHILVRQEAAAGHAAEGYARSTGKVGVCLVTSGPAATNLVTALQDALMDSIPIAGFTVQVPTHLIGNDAFQEADNVGITRSATKHNFLVKDGKDLGPIIRESFHIAPPGRPGRVHVDLPKDILVKETELIWPEKVTMRSYNPNYDGHPGQIKRAARAMLRAKKPVLYVGGGGRSADAAAQLLELAELTQIPVTTTLMGLGPSPSEHPLSLEMLGMHGTYYANFAVHNSDVLVAVGARFDDRVTGRVDAFAPNAEIIHIDIDPSSISKNLKVDVPIVGDCRRVLRALIEAVKQ